MTLAVEYRPSALDDVEEARDWYEARQPGLGRRFVSLFNATVDQVRDFPFASTEVFEGVRRALVPVFKYRV